MENRKHVMTAAVKGASYGFEKGFESALDHLRELREHMPGENSRLLVSKLIETIEDCSYDAQTGFIDAMELYVVVTDEMDVTTPQ